MRSLVNISGMSFGAISTPAVRALSLGAAKAGCWIDTGEGGLSPHRLEGGGDVIMQIGTAKHGVRDADGRPSPAKLREMAAHEQVRTFEIKLSQGAKPGKGGVLLGSKVATGIAQIRGIPVGQDFVNTARGFMFSLGCIQALRCHTNTCPTGSTAHNVKLQRGLVVEEKFERVANYCLNMNSEIDMIAHSCGLRRAREFRREHVRIVGADGRSTALNMLSPYPVARVS